MSGIKTTIAAASLLICGWSALAQVPTVAPQTLSFTYLINSGKFPAAAKLTATLPASASPTVIRPTAGSVPPGWLTVTPSSGYTPMTISVTVNPTSLSLGSYSGTVTVTAGSYHTEVTVTLAITSAPSSLIVTSANFDPSASGSTTPSLTFSYTSGGTLPSAEIDVSSTGDIIPFTVTPAVTVAKGSGSGSGSKTAGVWLRVGSFGGLPGLTTSGVAAAGSSVRISVQLDQTTLDTLDVGPYTATITIAAASPVNGSSTIAVTMNVAAGQPTLTTIFPSSLPAFPAVSAVKPVDPVITLVGTNFFLSSSHVFMALSGGIPIPLVTTWLSREVLQATIPAAYLTPAQSAPPYPVPWQVTVSNGAPGSNPSSSLATTTAVEFDVTDPTLPYVQTVVNAASYQPAAVQTGTGANPVTAPNSAVSPREIVSIFGQNLGPTTVVSGVTTGSPAVYQPTIPGCDTTVSFQIMPDPSIAQPGPMPAPLIMVSAGQINAIVPDGLADYAAGTPVTITVTNGPSTYSYTVAVIVPADPGIFTFGGNGQGQAAVLNFDSATGAVTVNGSKSAATRNSAIEIYATGLGDLVGGAIGMPDGTVASTAIKLVDDTYRVEIDGQSATVFYAGTAGNAVAGLVQLNAIVPPNAKTGGAIPIAVSIGPVVGGVATARKSQTGVTIAVK